MWLRGAGAALVVLALGGLAGGCQERVVATDGLPTPPRPRPRRRAPASGKPTQMALYVAASVQDADGNGYPDLIRAEVALYAGVVAVQARGAFLITLYRLGEATRAGAVPIGTWRIEGAAQQAAAVRTAYGTGYVLELSLLDGGTDRLPPLKGDLRGRFEPLDGGPALETSDEIRPVQIGRQPATGG